jgi:hypothetical protein
MHRLLPLLAALMVLAGLAWAPAVQAHEGHAHAAKATIAVSAAKSPEMQAAVVVTAASDCDDGCCDGCGCAGRSINCCVSVAAIAASATGKDFTLARRKAAHPWPADTGSRPGAAVSEIYHPPLFA